VSSSDILRGVIPIAPTPFADNGDLDLASQRRVLDCMIDQGVDGICILANYAKIEVPGTAAKLRGLIAAAGAAIAGPFDGEESITLMADLDAGATGTMPSAMLPDLIRPIVAHHRAGRRTEAAAAYARILPLINYENRQCGLRGTKAVMMAGGVIASDHVRHPLEPLNPETRAGLFELVAELAPLALRWGK
jgi:4-hydroxy-tetrahydrodipicolinate synthase